MSKIEIFDKNEFELESAHINELESHLDNEVTRLVGGGKRKKIALPGNPSLYLGLILLVLLFGVCFFPQSFTNMDPHGLERSQFVFMDGKLNMFAPPYGPSANWPWGTDLLGRDIKSLIIYGAAMTVFSAILITLVRTGIALIMAVFAAYGFKFAKDGIRIFSSFFSAFPLTMVVLLVISSGVDIGPKLIDGGYAVGLPVILVAAFLGWGRLAGLLTEKTTEILKMDFIEGERAIGKGKFKIAIENLVPHLLPQLVVLAFLEVSGVLLLLCQIGFFSILINGGFVNGDGEFIPPVGMDWASLLSVAPRFIIGGKYWLVLFPALAFAYSIFAFNLAGEGMGIELERNGSKIISQLRNAPSVFSPLRYLYQIKNFKEYKKTVVRKTMVLVALLLIVFWPATKGPVSINYGDVEKETKWLCQDRFRGRMAGTDLNKEISEKIEKEMKATGVEAFQSDLVQRFKLEPFGWTGKADITVSNSLIKGMKLIHRQDFQVTTPATLKGTFEVKNLANFGLEGARSAGFEDKNLKNKFVLVDVRKMPPWIFSGIMNSFNEDMETKGILYITDDRTDGIAEKNNMDRMKGKEFKIPNIRLTAEAGDRLKRINEFTINIDMEGNKTKDASGYNVIGKLSGKGKDIIIVGASIDGPGFDKNEKYYSASEAATAATLENMYKALAKKQGQLDKTIIFAMWDGSYTRDRGSLKFLEVNGEQKKALVFPAKLSESSLSGNTQNGAGNILYIDLGPIGRGEENTLLIDTSGCLPRDEFSMNFIKQIRGSNLKNKPKLIDEKITTLEKFDFNLKNINTIEFSQTDQKICRTPADVVEGLNRKSIENFGNYMANEIFLFAKNSRGGK